MDYYRSEDCVECQRVRVQFDGVCEKCLWDNDLGNYACITRPEEYDVRGKRYEPPPNDIL